MTEQRKLLFNMVPSGYKADGILELQMMKFGDSIPKGKLPRSSLSVSEQRQAGRIIGARIQYFVDEDPRLKAIAIYSQYAGRMVSVIKHAPDFIPIGAWGFNKLAQLGWQYDDESDVYGPSHSTWEPHILEFNTGTNEVGMVKGKEPFRNFRYSTWNINEGYYKLPEYKTYYDYDDQILPAIMFVNKGSQGREVKFGDSLLDAVNRKRWDNNLPLFRVHKAPMDVATEYSIYMKSHDWKFNKYPDNRSFLDEVRTIRSATPVDIEEYNRLVYVEWEKIPKGKQLINYQEAYDRAVEYWMNDEDSRANILRTEYNAAGFGVELIVSGYYYTCYMCLDLAKIVGVGLAMTAEELANLDPETKEKIQRGLLIVDSYSDEIEESASFYMNSYNPLCEERLIFDNYPIPSSSYFLVGFFNDITLLSSEMMARQDWENWPAEKRNDWTRKGWNPKQIEPIDPLGYPIILQEELFECQYLKAGRISKVTESDDGGYLYDVNVHTKTIRDAQGNTKGGSVGGEFSVIKDVRGFSRTKYEVGRWVVIHGAHVIYAPYTNEERISQEGWYILPTSSLYYQNVVESGAGIS